MGKSFQTIKTRPPWYKQPGALAALALFVILGAVAAFLFKGDEETLLGRVQASDPISPVCAYALGYRGIKNDKTRDAFEQILATGTTDKPAPDGTRRAVAYGLGMMHSKHPVLVLIDALQKDPNADVRGTAARALGRTGEPQAYEPLANALNTGDADMREAAAQGLMYLGDKRGIDPLIDHVEDVVPGVRHACHDALVSLTGQHFDQADEKAQWKKWREGNQ